MSAEPKHLSKTFGRLKISSLFVMIGFGIAAIGFLLLPVAIGVFPIAPVIIVAGFGLSLFAYFSRRIRALIIKKVRKEERLGHFND
jgi:hypothetical protein